MTWETVIGLETHVELSTKTKIFCSCTTEFGGAPNTHCCPVCMGMPGTLPVVNEKVLEYAVKVGLALDGEITRSCRFDRKNYFYPDLPKAYQISQLYLPIARDGHVEVDAPSGPCTVGIQIPSVFLFQGYLNRYGLQDWGRERYATLKVKAGACIQCGACETRCPYNLPIRRMMQQAAEDFGE